jgi:hypothetical protein
MVFRAEARKYRAGLSLAMLRKQPWTWRQRQRQRETIGNPVDSSLYQAADFSGTSIKDD